MNTSSKLAIALVMAVIASSVIVTFLIDDSEAYPAYDAYYTVEDDCYYLCYDINGDEAKVVWIQPFEGFDNHLVIPETIKDGEKEYTITSIGSNVSYDYKKFESVSIPDTVTTIDAYAFQSCSSLSYVELGNSVTTIGEQAFSACDLSCMIIPNSVTSIGTSAFSYPYLDILIIGDGNASIGRDIVDGSTVTIALGTLPQESCSNLIDEYSIDKRQNLYLTDYSGTLEIQSTYTFTSNDGNLSFNLNSGILDLVSSDGLNISYAWSVNGQDAGNNTNSIDIDDPGLYEMELTIEYDGSSVTVSYPYSTLSDNQNLVTFKDGNRILGYNVVNTGDTITNAPTPAGFKGLEFSGWSDEAGNTFETTTQAITDDITLYAKYDIKNFEVSIGVSKATSSSDTTNAYGFIASVVDPSPYLEYTYQWTSGSETVDNVKLEKPDISKQYTLTVTATYGSTTMTSVATTNSVNITMPSGAEVRVTYNTDFGPIDEYQFSSTQNQIYLPEGTCDIWFVLDGYTCKHESLTVSNNTNPPTFEYGLSTPSVDVYYDGSSLTGTISTTSESVTLEAKVKVANDSWTVTYQWYLNGVAMDGKTGDELTTTSSGEYHVEAFVTEGEAKSDAGTSFVVSVEFIESSDGSSVTVIDKPDGSSVTTITNGDTTVEETTLADNIGFVEMTATVLEVKDSSGAKVTAESTIVNSSDLTVVSEQHLTAVLSMVEQITNQSPESFVLTIKSGDTVRIDPKVLTTAKNKGMDLRISGNDVTITPDDDVIDTFAGQQTEKIEIIVDTKHPSEIPESVVAEVAGNATVVEVSALVEGIPMGDIGGAVRVDVENYVIANGQNPDDVRVFYIDEEGNVSMMENSGYDDGTLWFITDHFSYYIGADKTFNEPSSGWNDDDSLPPIFNQTEQGSDDAITVVACAAAAAAAALMAVFLIIDRRRN